MTSARLRVRAFLPSLLTLGSVFCGFAALALCAQPDVGPRALAAAATAIFLAAVLDLADGRLARLLHVSSPRGRELDSLADVISFGAAPALVVYRAALAPLGPLGVVVAATYCAAAAWRLARFNVLAAEAAPGARPGKFIAGLPVTVAAAALMSFVLLPPVAPTLVVAVVVASALLMVSRLPFRSFKDLRASRRTALGAAAAASALVLVGATLHLVGRSPALLLPLLLLGYVLMALREVLRTGA